MDYDNDNVFPRGKIGRDHQVRDLIRYGKVIDRKHDDKRGPLVRVQYLDKQGLISQWIPVKQFGSRGTQHYWCPKVNEDVIVKMLPNSGEHGFVDGSFYNKGNTPPTGIDVDTRHFQAADGTIISYSETNSSFTLQDTKGPVQVTGQLVTITATSTITLTAPTVIISGLIQHTGAMNTSGVHIDANGHHKSSLARETDLEAEVQSLKERVNALEAKLSQSGVSGSIRADRDNL